MLEIKAAFNGFSVNDKDEASNFYTNVLGLRVSDHEYGARILLPGDKYVFLYPKGDEHKPATYTFLNLVVDDIDAAADALRMRGVIFNPGAYTDEAGIQRGLEKGLGPDQAWFNDPSGNIISIICENDRV